MAVSADISTLTRSSEPYSARASINDGVIDAASSKVTGDRTSGLFDTKKQEMGKDDFLLLLVTQMRYQDPLNPMENTEFVSQLAQFRALEGSQNVEKAIGKLDESFRSTVDAQQYSAQSIANTAAVSLIGKTVRMKQSSIQWLAKAGETAPIRVHLGNATEALVELRDSDGTIVKTLKASGKDKENSVSLAWDGSTNQGGVAPGGTYSITIEGQENNAALYSFVEDTVAGVRFASDGALIKIGGKELSIGNVLDVSVGDAASQFSSISPGTAVALLGKDVRIRQTRLAYGQQPNETLTAAINMGRLNSVKVDILDSAGNVVKSVNVAAEEGGVGLLEWNGEDSEGALAPAGVYRLRIAGEDQDSSLYAFYEGTVDGISNLGGNAQLRVQGKIVSLSDIIDIADAKSSIQEVNG